MDKATEARGHLTCCPGPALSSVPAPTLHCIPLGDTDVQASESSWTLLGHNYPKPSTFHHLSLRQASQTALLEPGDIHVVSLLELHMNSTGRAMHIQVLGHTCYPCRQPQRDLGWVLSSAPFTQPETKPRTRHSAPVPHSQTLHIRCFLRTSSGDSSTQPNWRTQSRVLVFCLVLELCVFGVSKIKF